MKRYNPKDIEPRWQQAWEQAKIYEATEDPARPKKYVLEFFPYPSGAAMHVGHVRNYAIGDALARFYRQQGMNVLHPMGWDAFGLPAENYAIKTGVSPRQAIDENTLRFKEQLMQMGFSYDWSREIDSTDPKYYRWTQWLFLLLHKKGLAYQKESLQWWCDQCKTVLANEQVVNGKCWRHDGADDPLVKKRPLKQWFFKITDYADRLLDDLDDLNWTESIKSMQRNWIGRSKGAEVTFTVDGYDEQLQVFTTRPDTLYGATFMVLAPEHPLVEQITTAGQLDAVQNYVQESLAKSEIERQEESREKTGVPTGAFAVNPVNGEKIPIWIADYVLMGYGTGAIMAVPAHDERDHAFATKFDIPIIETYTPDNDTPFGGEGVVKDSGAYDGLRTEDMREKIVADLSKEHTAEEKVNYRFRDWLISRQRYWGAPIPIIHCADCGAVPVPEADLPVVLPEVENYQPQGTGKSPLAQATDWLNVDCPSCDGPAERETDTMDGFACSSWYFLRFADPHNDEQAFSEAKAQFWNPVDEYIGGAEHAVMHLLYARFWTKVMFDEGLINFTEPFTTLRNQGMILAPDGAKMSKSKGNTLEPGSMIDDGYGADAIRIMELFIGPWNQSAAWSVEGMGGCYRFLNRVWTLTQEFIESDTHETAEQRDVLVAAHKAIHKVTKDLHDMSFNTAISALMECTNELYKIKADGGFADKDAWRFALESVLQLLAPFAPHITEELWTDLGHDKTIHVGNWPEHDDVYLQSDSMKLAVQVNGKVRAEIEVAADASETDITQMALQQENVIAHVGGGEPKKVIYVKNRLVSIVV